MRKITSLTIVLLLSMTGLATGPAAAGPQEDQKAFRDFYQQRFPDLSLADFANGAYAIDKDAYDQWQEIEEFAPYEFALDDGKALFETPFKNGKGYASCFEKGGIGISQNFPHFDTDAGKVVTLELAINNCREENGEAALAWLEGPIAAISGYMVSTSRGNPVNTVVPDDAGALEAYESGKQYYYSRRGQLNFSCQGCHVQNVGMMIRADRLGPSLGQTTHWPAHRGSWEALGTLHRRFQECNKQVRAVPLDGQSEEYRNLEYFMSFMDSGLPVNGPAYRK